MALLKVSSTAYSVAYRRTLAQIEYAKEIYEELEKIKASPTSKGASNLKKIGALEITPYFEARYKLVNRLLKQYGTYQILEIAAGFSPRGLAMTNAKPKLNYVELDLESIVAEKEKIYQTLARQGKIKSRGNLHLEKGDALNPRSLRLAVRHFEKKPLTVINEGLMRYLTFAQKAQYAKNIARLLGDFGGVWLTPDITLKGALEAVRERRIQTSKDLGIDLEANLFENENQARQFFEDLGFTVEAHPFREIAAELISPQKLGTSAEALKDMLDKPVVFVMRLA